MVRAYIMCNGGDFFRGTHCPLDGWSGPQSIEFMSALRTLEQAGKQPTIAAFRELNVSEAVLRNMITIEFGDDRAASGFEIIVPDPKIPRIKAMKYQTS